jgi:hydrogenase maturation factor
VVHTISGCDTSSVERVYEDPEFGIRLEIPRNWSLKSYKRNGSIVLESGNGLFEKDSARVEIYGIACAASLDASLVDWEEVLEANIKRIGDLYGPDPITILQPLNKVDSENYEIYTTKIQIPTISIPKDSPRNQVGVRDSNTLQTVELYLIRDESNNGIWVEVYTGNSVQLNDEAEEIVNSVELICLP